MTPTPKPRSTLWMAISDAIDAVDPIGREGYSDQQMDFIAATVDAALDRARATAEPVLLEELDARLESLAALKKRADTMPIMNEWQWLNSLRNRLKGRLGATVAPSPTYDPSMLRAGLRLIEQMTDMGAFNELYDARAASGASPEPTADLRDALEKLCNEAEGISELARGSAGHTNVACLLHRVKIARAALAVGTEIPQKHSADPVASGSPLPDVDGTV